MTKLVACLAVLLGVSAPFAATALGAKHKKPNPCANKKEKKGCALPSGADYVSSHAKVHVRAYGSKHGKPAKGLRLLTLSSPCPLEPGAVMISGKPVIGSSKAFSEHSDGLFAKLDFTGRITLSSATRATVTYHLKETTKMGTPVTCDRRGTFRTKRYS